MSTGSCEVEEGETQVQTLTPLEFDALLAQYHAEVWAAAEEGQIAYDEAGVATAKKLCSSYQKLAVAQTRSGWLSLGEAMNLLQTTSPSDITAWQGEAPCPLDKEDDLVHTVQGVPVILWKWNADASAALYRKKDVEAWVQWKARKSTQEKS